MTWSTKTKSVCEWHLWSDENLIC